MKKWKYLTILATVALLLMVAVFWSPPKLTNGVTRISSHHEVETISEKLAVVNELPSRPITSSSPDTSEEVVPTTSPTSTSNDFVTVSAAEKSLLEELAVMNLSAVQVRARQSNDTRLRSLEAELQFLCSLRVNDELQLLQWVKHRLIPNTEVSIKSARWLAKKLAPYCAGVSKSSSPRSTEDGRRVTYEARARSTEISLYGNIEMLFAAAQSKPELIDTALIGFLVKADSPYAFRLAGSLNMYSKAPWDLGANFYAADTRNRRSLALAQRIALDRRACDYSRLCGPEQYDSLLLCAEFSVCRPGVTSAQVWADVASIRELRAADSVYAALASSRAR